jgi:hypothetical protein
VVSFLVGMIEVFLEMNDSVVGATFALDLLQDFGLYLCALIVPLDCADYLQNQRAYVLP